VLHRFGSFGRTIDITAVVAKYFRPDQTGGKWRNPAILLGAGGKRLMSGEKRDPCPIRGPGNGKAWSSSPMETKSIRRRIRNFLNDFNGQVSDHRSRL